MTNVIDGITSNVTLDFDKHSIKGKVNHGNSDHVALGEDLFTSFISNSNLRLLPFIQIP